MAAPAVTLPEVLNLFDPRSPLGMDQLDAYYVARPHAPLDPMKIYLKVTNRPAKVLFCGHRGSGKSTELTRLAKDLEDEFFVVRFSARSLDLADLNYVDIALATAIALFRAASERASDVEIPDSLWRDVHDWMTNEITSETTVAKTTSGAFGGRIQALFFSIEAKYGKETSTRDTMRERLLPRVNDLIDRVNEVCQKIEAATGRPPLLIFEDIDKTDLAQARELFFEHSTTLNSPACHIIYTFPISLYYSSEFTGRIGDYSRHFTLPNISLHDKDGVSNPAGREALTNVVLRRAPDKLFAPGVLDQITELSGGLVRNLVRIVSDAALRALTVDSPVITREIVEEVAADMTNDYRRLLLPEHHEELRRAQSSKTIVPNETVQQLLDNLSLLEYLNTETWCDVTPVVRTLID